MKRIDMRGYKILPRYMLNVGVILYFQLCLNTCGMENWIDGGKNALSSSQVLFAKNCQFIHNLRSEETAPNPCILRCFTSSVMFMGVCKNRGTPKWMVYNGKPY